MSKKKRKHNVGSNKKKVEINWGRTKLSKNEKMLTMKSSMKDYKIVIFCSFWFVVWLYLLSLDLEFTIFIVLSDSIQLLRHFLQTYSHLFSSVFGFSTCKYWSIAELFFSCLDFIVGKNDELKKTFKWICWVGLVIMNILFTL